MSAEGLLGEVSALLGVRLNIKAADQAFFGGKRVFSNVSNEAVSTCTSNSGSAKGQECPVKKAISNAKQIVDNALSGKSVSGNFADSEKILAEINTLRKENSDIKNEIAQLKNLIAQLSSLSLASPSASAPAPVEEQKEVEAEEKKDDDFDLFGSEDEEEDAEKKKITEERLKAYAEKKSKKAGPIAKSSVILDVKPWDDETDLKEMENNVRGIEMDGLVWGGAKLIPIGYGIQKLQIISVVEDLKVSVDELIEKIQEFEDFVQSVDIVAFNKI